MGKNLIQQARGKGGPRYRAPSFRYKGESKLRSDKIANGEIIDIIHCPGHNSPLMEIKYDDGKLGLLQAPEGICVGDTVNIGEDVSIKAGNALPLNNIPEGTSVYNIENNPGDGGRFVRSSGGFAKIVTKLKDKVIVKLPSNKNKTFRPECRAIIGIIAGSGRTEKPFLKAGNRYYKMKAKNKLWPQTSGTSMNSVDHPFGGSSSSNKGRPTQSARNDPPGRKVGKIAPSRTGRKKR